MMSLFYLEVMLRKETEKSDIDLLIINQDGKNPFRSQVRSIV